MNSQRRNFMKVCGGAAGVAAVPGLAGASLLTGADARSAAAADAAHVEKSIKAGFGGGFSVQSHRAVDGLVYADIRHGGSRYLVTSPDLFDWQVVAASPV